MKCIKCGTPINQNEELCIDCASLRNNLEIIDFPEDVVDIIDIYPNDNVTVDNFIDTITDKLEQTEGNIDVPQIIEQTIEEIKTNKKSKKTKKSKTKQPLEPKLDPELIVILVLLAVSVCTNAYLIINSGNKLAKNTTKNNTDTVIQTTAYSNYKLNMPVNWITTENNNQLMIYDETEMWAAGIRLVNNISYDIFLSNKDNFIKEMLTEKYVFTSNYTKETNSRNNYLYKGKYNDYSVYVIITELPNNILAITDLKFKSEVNDIVLNEILKMCGTLEEKTTDMFENEFNFNDFTEIIFNMNQE